MLSLSRLRKEISAFEGHFGNAETEASFQAYFKKKYWNQMIRLVWVQETVWLTLTLVVLSGVIEIPDQMGGFGIANVTENIGLMLIATNTCNASFILSWLFSTDHQSAFRKMLIPVLAYLHLTMMLQEFWGCIYLHLSMVLYGLLLGPDLLPFIVEIGICLTGKQCVRILNNIDPAILDTDPLVELIAPIPAMGIFFIFVVSYMTGMVEEERRKFLRIKAKKRQNKLSKRKPENDKHRQSVSCISSTSKQLAHAVADGSRPLDGTGLIKRHRERKEPSEQESKSIGGQVSRE